MSNFNDFILEQFEASVDEGGSTYDIFSEQEWFSYDKDNGFTWKSIAGDKIWDWVDENVLGKKVSLDLSEFLYSQYDPEEVIEGLEALYKKYESEWSDIGKCHNCKCYLTEIDNCCKGFSFEIGDDRYCTLCYEQETDTRNNIGNI